MSSLGPFQTGSFEGRPYGSCTVEDRKKMVRHFDRQQCFDALQVEGLQTTVRAAICRRLRALQAEEDAQAKRRSSHG